MCAAAELQVSPSLPSDLSRRVSVADELLCCMVWLELSARGVPIPRPIAGDLLVRGVASLLRAGHPASYVRPALADLADAVLAAAEVRP